MSVLVERESVYLGGSYCKYSREVIGLYDMSSQLLRSWEKIGVRKNWRAHYDCRLVYISAVDVILCVYVYVWLCDCLI
jgi:hypothetical protein